MNPRPVTNPRLIGLTQEKIRQLDEHDLAELASLAPPGLVAVFGSDGRFSFTADNVIAEMSPERRAALTIVSPPGCSAPTQQTCLRG